MHVNYFHYRDGQGGYITQPVRTFSAGHQFHPQPDNQHAGHVPRSPGHQHGHLPSSPGHQHTGHIPRSPGHHHGQVPRSPGHQYGYVPRSPGHQEPGLSPGHSKTGDPRRGGTTHQHHQQQPPGTDMVAMTTGAAAGPGGYYAGLPSPGPAGSAASKHSPSQQYPHILGECGFIEQRESTITFDDGHKKPHHRSRLKELHTDSLKLQKRRQRLMLSEVGAQGEEPIPEHVSPTSSMTSGSKISTPGGSTLNTPGGSTVNTPGGSTLHTPAGSTFNTPRDSKRSTPRSSKNLEEATIGFENPNFNFAEKSKDKPNDLESQKPQPDVLINPHALDFDRPQASSSPRTANIMRFQNRHSDPVPIQNKKDKQSEKRKSGPDGKKAELLYKIPPPAEFRNSADKYGDVGLYQARGTPERMSQGSSKMSQTSSRMSQGSSPKVPRKHRIELTRQSEKYPSLTPEEVRRQHQELMVKEKKFYEKLSKVKTPKHPPYSQKIQKPFEIPEIKPVKKPRKAEKSSKPVDQKAQNQGLDAEQQVSQQQVQELVYVSQQTPKPSPMQVQKQVPVQPPNESPIQMPKREPRQELVPKQAQMSTADKLPNQRAVSLQAVVPPMHSAQTAQRVQATQPAQRVPLQYYDQNIAYQYKHIGKTSHRVKRERKLLYEMQLRERFAKKQEIQQQQQEIERQQRQTVKTSEGKRDVPGTRVLTEQENIEVSKLLASLTYTQQSFIEDEGEGSMKPIGLVYSYETMEDKPKIDHTGVDGPPKKTEKVITREQMKLAKKREEKRRREEEMIKKIEMRPEKELEKKERVITKEELRLAKEREERRLKRAKDPSKRKPPRSKAHRSHHAEDREEVKLHRKEFKIRHQKSGHNNDDGIEVREGQRNEGVTQTPPISHVQEEFRVREGQMYEGIMQTPPISHIQEDFHIQRRESAKASVTEERKTKIQQIYRTKDQRGPFRIKRNFPKVHIQEDIQVQRRESEAAIITDDSETIKQDFSQDIHGLMRKELEKEQQAYKEQEQSYPVEEHVEAMAFTGTEFKPNIIEPCDEPQQSEVLTQYTTARMMYNRCVQEMKGVHQAHFLSLLQPQQKPRSRDVSECSQESFPSRLVHFKVYIGSQDYKKIL